MICIYFGKSIPTFRLNPRFLENQKKVPLYFLESEDRCRLTFPALLMRRRSLKFDMAGDDIS